MKPRNIKYIPVTETNRVDCSQPNDSNIPKDRNHWSARPVDKWSSKQFIEYFYDCYLNKAGLMHPRSERKHMSMMNRLVKAYDGDRTFVRNLIDIYFNMGYDLLGLEHFSSSARQTELQTFVRNGQKPFYLQKREQYASPPPVQQPEPERQPVQNTRSFEDFLGGK